jgi:hypothetical protein
LKKSGKQKEKNKMGELLRMYHGRKIMGESKRTPLLAWAEWSRYGECVRLLEEVSSDSFR